MIKSFIKALPLIVIILGIITIIMGFYFDFIMTGIPYQDPTPELLNKYLYYLRLGKQLYKIGFIIELVGCVSFVIKKIITSKARKAHNQ